MEIDRDIFAEVLKLAGDLTDELHVDVRDDGWHMVCIDPAKVAMASIRIGSDVFEDYEKGESFGLMLRNSKNNRLLADSIARMGKKVSIKVGDGLAVFSSDGITAKFRLLDFDQTPKKVPDLKDMDCDFIINVDHLKRLGSITAKFTDHYDLELDENYMTLSAIDDDGIGMTVKVEREKLLGSEGTAKASYPMDYFNIFLNAVPADSPIEVKFKTDYPACLCAGTENFEIRYLISPRIER